MYNHFSYFPVYPLPIAVKTWYNIGMIIDKIETKRNKTTVYVGEKIFPFCPEILQKYGISEGETDGKKFFEAKDESDLILTRRALYAMIDRSEKSKKGYLDALTGKGYPYSKCLQAVTEAEEKNLVSDERYAECFIHSHEKTYGWYRIAAALKAKGVPEDIVSSFKEDFGDHTDECVKAAKKLSKNVEKTYENKQKLYAKLIRKGFGSDEIARALDELGFSSRFDD